ncbi:MAG: hypothetical protein JF886_03475 [Candidatus Dormibacteraeota bacterium]|uniref:Photosynthesis system II assembly factor Ycf48/Hcf136-like domain-containing protein n=1 Tax=Candidatus Aeolococcus gillhamiae TaxID=3127015 RepID=A0A2W5YYY2_9BACT|nr:hypothetical protein [Candidatus Dormibacteraeota bacterium]PZR78030.1 MAG: hypothetical protein DLM65_14105 [Candidatus Dormibacter sp. RRmetagenome_bin12]
MPDRDDDLARGLRDYYQRVAQQPAPDVTGRVMMSADNRAALRRRWTAICGGIAGVAAVAAVIVVALVNHNTAPVSAPAQTGAPTNGTTPVPGPSTSPTPLVRTAPPPPLPPGGPVPPGFTGVSATFTSPYQGWVLGTAPCAKRPCTSILRTVDGGATWKGVPAPRIELAGSAPFGIIRFADPLDGWVAAGAQLQVTHDGGATWYAAALPGVQASGVISDLETSAGVVDAWAIRETASAGPSMPATLYHASTTQDSWSTAPGVATTNGGYGQLSLVGSHGWLVVGSTHVYSTSDGTTWTARSSPCPAQQPVGIAAANASTVYASCTVNGSAGGSMVTRTMKVSHDGGASFQSTSPPPQTGDFSGIAATPNGRTVALAVSTAGPGSIQLSNDGGAHWKTPYSADQTGGAGFADLGFTTDSQGVVVLAPGQSGVLFLSHDGGLSWRAVRF